MKKAIAAFALFAAMATATALPPAATAGSQGNGTIVVENPWARASAGSAKSGGAFMTIKNRGKEADRLIAAKSPVAKRASLHQTLIKDGVMKMRPAGAIDVPAGGMVMLKPGSYHVMFMGLREPLKKGATFPLALTFEKAGEIVVTVSVRKAGAMNGMGGMKMKRDN